MLICCAYYLHFPFNLRYDTEADYLDSLAVYRVHVTEPPLRKSYGWLLNVNLPEHAQQAVIYLSADSSQATPVMGDLLLVRTRITRPRALFIGEFDYGNYLRLQHKVGVGYVRPGQWQIIGHVPIRGLRAYATTVQRKLAQRYSDAGLHGQPLALISAITLGERDALDSDLRQSFAAAGAAHVLAVSGLHTGIIYIVVVSLLTCFGLWRPLYEQRIRRALLSSCIIAVMWAYAFITGLSPSVMRAALMLTIIQVGWICRRQSISFNTLAAAACICLWIDPLSLFSVSFQLSFAAVAGILLFVPHFNSVWRVHSKFARFMRDLVTVSAAATIGTLPVSLYYFSQVARCFLLTNLVVLPATYVLVILGLLVLALAHTPLGAWLAFALQHLGGWVCTFVAWIEHLPYSTLHISATPSMLACLVMAIGCCYLRIQRQRLSWYAPAAAAIALFCVLHVFNAQQTLNTHTLATRGRTIYYSHGGTTETFAPDSRYTFFRFRNNDYVYAPYLSPRRQQVLEQYCRNRNIHLWEGKTTLTDKTVPSY
ncbi:MAG: ComEC/Rec2 family competence protein [Paludibacteraceae bacterium]|nr:ComEC/Rec2 family competence protein [Paludibacteraceae bacterium]